MSDDEDKNLREMRMVAKATVELFGNGAVAKTKERLAEVEAEGDAKGTVFWRALLKEVLRLHALRHRY